MSNIFVSVAGVIPPSDMPPADGRRTKMYFVSIADLCAAARTLAAFLNLFYILIILYLNILRNKNICPPASIVYQESRNLTMQK